VSLNFFFRRREINFKFISLDPKPSDLTSARLSSERDEGRTRVCYKTLGRANVRGERLIKLGYSWFSAKFIQVKSCFKSSLVGQ
jgi:hypothetical protein